MINTNNKNMYPGYDNNVSKEQYNNLVEKLNTLMNYVSSEIANKSTEYTSSDNSITINTTKGEKITVDFKLADAKNYISNLHFYKKDNKLVMYDIDGNVMGEVKLQNDYITNLDYNSETGIITFYGPNGEVIDTVGLPNEGTLRSVYYDEDTNEFVYEFSSGEIVRIPSYEELKFSDIVFSSEKLEEGRALRSITINGDKWYIPESLGTGNVDLSSIEAQLNSINSSIISHDTRITSLENSIEELPILEDRVDSLETYSINNNSNITSLIQSVNNITTAVSSLDNSVANYRTEVERLINDITGINNRIDNLEDPINVSRLITPATSPTNSPYYILVSEGLGKSLKYIEYTGGSGNGDIDISILQNYATKEDLSNVESMIPDMVMYYDCNQINAMMDLKVSKSELDDEIVGRLQAYATKEELNEVNAKIDNVSQLLDELNGEVI